MSLVPRFYDPITGGVFLDGRNLRELTKKSLRAQIGMVLQDTVLFSTTIKENIAYGRPGATDRQIIEVAATSASASASASALRELFLKTLPFSCSTSQPAHWILAPSTQLWRL